MTHVRISKELLDSIKKSAQDTFLTANPKPSNNVNLTNTILDAMRAMPAYIAAEKFATDPEVEKLRLSLTTSSLKNSVVTFLEARNVKQINVHGFKATGKPTEVTFSSLLTVPLTMRWVNQYQGGVDLHINQFPEPFKSQAIAAIQTSIDAEDAWETSRKEYTAKTDAVFNACKSTKQLLEAWPAADKFLPQAVIQKIHEKKVETPEDIAARELREKFDPSEFDANILIAGMLGDNKA